MRGQLLAYAKLNLSLRVLGKRTDGYHEIESVVQTVSLADLIHLELIPAFAGVDCLPRFPGGNIAAHAAARLMERKGSSIGVRIRITKRIPMGAGLGGGSSDAAAVLRALDSWIEPKLPRDELFSLASQLGSDVPLFLDGGCQTVSGRGELLTACPLRTESFVLLIPPIHCSTRDVYHAWVPHGEANPATPAKDGSNDLYPAALRVAPSLAAYGQAIHDLPAEHAGMTGSGAGFFAAFADAEAAAAAQAELSEKFPRCETHLCRSVPRGSEWVSEGRAHAHRH